jgi:hypothetical protein
MFGNAILENLVAFGRNPLLASIRARMTLAESATLCFI